MRAFIFIMLFLATVANAKDVFYDRETVFIKIPYIYNSVTRKSIETILRFPMEVYSISQATRFKIGPVNPKDPDYSELKIRPYFTTGSQTITFSLADGSNIEINITPEKDPDGVLAKFYDIKPKIPYKNTTSQFDNVSQLDFLRKAISGHKISGYETSNMSKRQTCGSRRVEFRYKKVISGSRYKAFLLTVKNKNLKKIVRFNPEKLYIKHFPKNHSYMVQTDVATILPKKETTMVLGVMPDTSASDIYLCGRKNAFITTEELSDEKSI